MALRSIQSKIKSANQLRVKALDPSGGANKLHYKSPKHQAWSKAVKARDGYKCQGPGPHNGPLIADHIIEIEDGGDRLALSNGMTLCSACHARKTAIARRLRLDR